MDATLADPRGFEEWAQPAILAGVPVLFEWLPLPEWIDNPVIDSDLVVFYLSDDRTTVRARVQRQLFETVHEIHAYAAPIILDRVVATGGRYQLLVSDAAGDPLEGMLLSDPYIGEIALNPHDEESLAASPPVIEDVLVEQTTWLATGEEELVASPPVIEDVRVENPVYPYAGEEELVASPPVVEDVEVVSNVFGAEDEEELVASPPVVEDVIAVTVVIMAESEEELRAEPPVIENIRVQTV
jgi:hypothetical protein